MSVKGWSIHEIQSTTPMFSICARCLAGRTPSVTYLAGDGKTISCDRCGERTSDYVQVSVVCSGCKLPDLKGGNPDCGTCVAREVMES